MNPIAEDVVDLEIRPQGKVRGWLVERLLTIKQEDERRPGLDVLLLLLVCGGAFELFAFQ